MARDILDRLRTVWACRRCGCGSCDRGGAGELHDHVCTDGEHCVETRERLRARRVAEVIVAQDAAQEIQRLRREAECHRAWARMTLDGFDEATIRDLRAQHEKQ